MPEAGAGGCGALQRTAGALERPLRQAKDDRRRAASTRARSRWRCSGSRVDDLDPLVDDVRGVASFFMEVDGPVTFV